MQQPSTATLPPALDNGRHYMHEHNSRLIRLDVPSVIKKPRGWGGGRDGKRDA